MVPVCEVPPYSNEVECHYVLKESKVDSEELFIKLNNDLGNKNLSIALVSVAWGESRLNAAAAGDSGAYAANKSEAINIAGPGPACSFGLWQYNICGGLGSLYLDHYKGSGKKIDILIDYNMQINFMVNYIQSNYSNLLNKDFEVKSWLHWYFSEIGRGASATEFYVESRYAAAIKHGFINFE